MKNNIFKGVFLLLISLLGLISCSDREIVTVDNQSAPILMDVSKESVFLDKHFPDNPAFNVTWDVAKYTVPVQITYKIEVSADNKFTKPFVLGTVANSARTATFTNAQMNTAAQTIGLVKDVEGTMYIRVSSYLGNGENLTSTSNVSMIKITPYELEYPTFYIVGAASFVGWSAVDAQVLYKSSNKSMIYTYLEGGQPFRFLGQKNWDPLNYSIDLAGTRENYRYFKQVSSNLIQDGEENMKFTGATGIYKITINAATGVQSIDVAESAIPTFDFPQIYIVGTINGWDAATAPAMTKVAPGVYEYTVKLDDNSEFKFLGQRSWGDIEWANIMKDNAGNSGFLGPKGDNGNVKFNGGGKTYKITANVKAGIYTIVEP
ncbi:SusE domain-containing protein [Cloacibacterium sp. TD35]|uniref:SusE domain-containing protein n=1 Tax=Cloacibacterium sp. TD35 TaxID=2976818 RepID=UPI00237E609E|nr:SusE domain-containing protein [Cloacibacterium sp. TD35]WDT67318.1 SusE domain-containing protein [Cloacibacterium sp. TD35]